MKAPRRRHLVACSVAGYLLILVISLTALSCQSHPANQRARVVDSFEGGAINGAVWTRAWWVEHKGRPTNQESRDGGASLRVTVSEGDKGLRGRSGQETERSELLERYRSPVGAALLYSFSFLIPEDFPIVDVRLVVGQWKQTTAKLRLKHSPVIAQRYRNGRFSITIDNDSGQKELFAVGTPSKPALVGQWADLSYRIRFSKDDSGVLDVWMNGVQIVSYRGQLGYASDGDTTYFRLGLYRDTMTQPMTAYFDSFSRESLGVDVAELRQPQAEP